MGSFEPAANPKTRSYRLMARTGRFSRAGFSGYALGRSASTPDALITAGAA